MSDDTQQTQTTATVSVKIQQAYDLNLTLNLLPARAIPNGLKLACQPRQGAQRIDKDPLDLPEPMSLWLLGVNEHVAAWLASDENNQRAFIANPIAALREAGVPMEREQLKAISRLRQDIGMSQAVVPGLQLRSVQTTASQSGRVKPVDIRRSDWEPPALRHHDNDCGCGKKPGRN